MALSGDTALVGVNRDDVGANTDQGTARVFTRSGGVWSAQATLSASDGAANDRFGQSVALSGDTALVGAHLDDVREGLDGGSASFARIASDYGDALDPTYPSVRASDGARHFIDTAGPTLGAAIDAETDATTNSGATGDDIAGTDDEDGVSFGTLISGSSTTLTATVGNGPARLDAWIDYNRDGDWADAGERIFSARSVSTGSNALAFTVPTGLGGGSTVARVRLSSGGVAGATGQAVDGEVEDHQVSILTAAAAGTVQFAPNGYSLAEEAGNAVLTVTRTAPLTYASSVQYTTQPVAATAGSDYTTTTGTLTWAAGDGSSRTITVPILNDANSEPTERFRVNLSNPSGTSLGRTNIAAVDITDTDSTGGSDKLQFNPNTYTVNEEAGSVILTVTRTGTGVGAASVSATTSNVTAMAGLDYTARTRTINWGDGDIGTKFFTVSLLDDTGSENTETFRATLSAPTGAVLGTTYIATVSITDTDGGSGNDVIRFAPNEYMVNEGAGTATLTVTRSGTGVGAVSVSYQTDPNFYPIGTANVTDAGDYTPVSGTLSWSNGDLASKTIMVPLTDDTTAENTESLAVTITDAVDCTIGPQYVGVVRVLDND